MGIRTVLFAGASEGDVAVDDDQRWPSALAPSLCERAVDALEITTSTGLRATSSSIPVIRNFSLPTSPLSHHSTAAISLRC